jgi:hypothetical protein
MVEMPGAALLAVRLEPVGCILRTAHPLGDLLMAIDLTPHLSWLDSAQLNRQLH